MRLPRRIAVLMALVGFVGCIAASAAWSAMSCCTPVCDPCPILVSKTVVASSPHKANSQHALLPAAFQLLVLSRASFHVRYFTQVTTALPSEFRSPMRN